MPLGPRRRREEDDVQDDELEPRDPDLDDVPAELLAAHGRTGNLLTEDGVERVTVYVVPSLFANARRRAEEEDDGG